MTQIGKKVEKFINDPGSAKFADLERILYHFGFVKVQAKGSHIKFKHPRLANDLIVPVHRSECKDFYKKEAAKLIKKLKN